MTPQYQELLEAHERGYGRARLYEDKCIDVAKTFMRHMRQYLSDRIRPERNVPTATEKGWWHFPFVITFPADNLPCSLMYQVINDEVEFSVQTLGGPKTTGICPRNADGIRDICEAVFAQAKDACENSLEWYQEGMNDQRFGVAERSKR